jgi:C1A family cysteine protease
VALVGYRAGAFIVRNSWGTGWGDKGFAYASLAYAQDAFTEAYGVEV